MPIVPVKVKFQIISKCTPNAADSYVIMYCIMSDVRSLATARRL